MKHTDWYKDAIIYQIYPRSFLDTNDDGLGDIKGIIKKLDYLKELGINCVWLSPVYDSPQEDNGYDISNYYDIYPPFGTLDDFKTMLSEMHKRGIKLIMDLVVNHTSSEHPYFQDVLKNKDSKYKDFYIIKKGKKNGKKPPNNWSGFFGEKAWEKLPDSEDEYYLHLFAKGQPDLNWENPEVREEVKRILRFWLDMGVDGFRCDVINLISKKQDYKSRFPKPALVGSDAYINGPRLHEYLQELYRDVFSQYDCMTVGETVFTTLDDCLNLTNKEHPELDMVFNFKHVDADDYFGVKYFAKKFRLTNFKKIFRVSQHALYNKSWNTLFIENHDQRRSVGRFGTDESTYRIESACSLAATYFLMQGTPFIYQGQEIATPNPYFASLDEITDVEVQNINKLRNKVPLTKLIVKEKRMIDYSRENARSPMMWDDSIYCGFSNHQPWSKVNIHKDKVNVKEALANKKSTFYFYQKLIEIRKNYQVVKDGNYVDLKPHDNKVFIYKRESETEELVVVSSFYKKEITRKYLDKYRDYELLLSNYSNDNLTLLKPYETRVYYKKK